MQLFFEQALLPTGIAGPIAVTVAADGTIDRIGSGAPPADRDLIRGLALPGMPNLHSHAFQRALAGSTETAGSIEDSFWTWRDAMYRFVARLEPADVAAIAAFAYLEMLESGYTAVAEFHYLHHQPNGDPYSDRSTLAAAVRSGAAQAGIRQLLLPTLYQTSGFGGRPPHAGQRRFVQDADAFLRLVEQLRRHESSLHTTGIALHSLRAVPPDALRDVVAGVSQAAPRAPIHIHIAEQRQEVEDCRAWSGRRPVEWLLETGLVDARWCLVHATHVEDHEIHGMARSGAVIGLCPTTEANLGDGRFALDSLIAAGGRFGVGSDSHVSIDPREELRAAEYTLRLWRERRVRTSSALMPHCGTFLYSAAAAGGAQALGFANAGLAPGAPADIVVVDTGTPFAGVAPDALVDAYLFAPRPAAVRDVLVAGAWVMRDRRHLQHDAIHAGYREAIGRLGRP